MRSLPTFSNLHELRVIHRPDQNVVTYSNHDHEGRKEEDEIIVARTVTKTKTKIKDTSMEDIMDTITADYIKSASDVAAIADRYSYHSFYSYDQSHQPKNKGCNTPCATFSDCDKHDDNDEVPLQLKLVERCTNYQQEVLQDDDNDPLCDKFVTIRTSSSGQDLDNGLSAMAMATVTDTNDPIPIVSTTATSREATIPMMYFDPERLLYTPFRTRSSSSTSSSPKSISCDSYTFWTKRDQMSSSFDVPIESMYSIYPFFHNDNQFPSIEKSLLGTRDITTTRTHATKIEGDDSWGQFVDLVG